MRTNGIPPRVLVLLLSAVLVGVSGLAHADQLLAGKKLLIKNPPLGPTANKLVHLGKDASITIGAAGGAGDPQCSGANGGGGSLRIVPSGGASEVTIPLPCGNWSTNAANTRYKYTDPSGATCQLVLVKSGVVAKAVCKGTQVAVNVAGGMAPVAVTTTVNQESYCTEFGGTSVKDGSDGLKFLAKDADPPGACAPSCTVGAGCGSCGDGECRERAEGGEACVSAASLDTGFCGCAAPQVCCEGLNIRCVTPCATDADCQTLGFDHCVGTPDCGQVCGDACP